MKYVIYKYQLSVVSIQSIIMPIGSEILSVQNQGETPCIWAKVPYDSAGEELRRFEIFGTGETFYKNDSRVFIGTFQLGGGDFVGHLFEIKSK